MANKSHWLENMSRLNIMYQTALHRLGLRPHTCTPSLGLGGAIAALDEATKLETMNAERRLITFKTVQKRVLMVNKDETSCWNAVPNPNVCPLGPWKSFGQEGLVCASA